MSFARICLTDTCETLCRLLFTPSARLYAHCIDYSTERGRRCRLCCEAKGALLKRMYESTECSENHADTLIVNFFHQKSDHIG